MSVLDKVCVRMKCNGSVGDVSFEVQILTKNDEFDMFGLLRPT